MRIARPARPARLARLACLAPFARLARLASFASLAALAGCATTGGSFEPDGFHQGQFPLAVHYTAPETKDFLGPDWRIDNFYLFDDGTIGSRKTTKAYAGRQVIDLRGDGRLTKLDAFYFDLKLDNRKTSAVIWLQTLPLGRNETDRNLKNLVEDYADDLSGTGFFAAVNDGRALKSKTYAARIVSGADTTLGKLPAYDARLELANLDQIRLDPSARTALIRVVLVKTDYKRWIGDEDSHLEARMLVRVGYSASPSDFDASLPDFERFLKLIELGPPAPRPNPWP
jgi:hypothetical protein